MPVPNKGEDKKSFVSRCIPYVMKEDPSMKQDHAIAKCYGIWEQKAEEDRKTKADEMMRDQEMKSFVKKLDEAGRK